MNLKSGINDLLGGAVNQYASMSQLASAQQARVTRDVPMHMVQSGDVIIRPVRNGYNVIVVRNMGQEVETYVATDANHLTDVIKLAFVNRAMDGAK